MFSLIYGRLEKTASSSYIRWLLHHCSDGFNKNFLKTLTFDG